ncbi:Clavaminate synthase-like protein [Trametes versicolor FP-101664 SS1]|uniref:Clavaminate synthase-like protein n=1 Tax=Trametes versicolor (strain FP-101664) TaxID=717944 RepID=UPI0004621DFF|nr:Clavaminate synthase-like protein [Trametes versicolor FP-101664 SS1]EIW61789.1 Clavaminate synthase-like protein [Trametes versicolor FP-101664 SS1]
MNNMHDASVHNKRTSINELLNPVGATSSSSAYGHQQLPSISTALQYVPPPHPHHHAQAPPQYPPLPQQSQVNAGTQYSLRAASWDSSKDEQGPRRMEPEAAAPCRYPPAPQQQHPAYVDNYARHARPGGEAPPYSMEVPTWTSSHETPSASYAPPMMSPVYSDERTAASGEALQRNYAPQAHPQHPHYEHDISRLPPPPPQHPSYVPNYMPYPYAHPHAPPRGAPSHPMHPPPAHRAGPPAHPGYYPAPMNMAYAAIPIPPPPTLQQKRTSESVEEDQGGPKAKKARGSKAKAADSTAPSRRGTKKRGDSSQMSTQNAQLILSTHVPSTKGKEKASSSSAPAYTAMRVVTEDGSSNPEASGPLQPELQFARCMSNRYRSEEFPRCVSCTRRWAGDTCRFQGIRFFLKNQNRDIVGISFVESQKPDAPTMNFPNKWNIDLQMEHIRRVKRTVAEALLPILKLEQSHLGLPEIIRRPRESEVRATCDTCMTSIFSSSWMCRLCGREACAECFEQVKELTTDRIGAPEAEIAALQARRERHAHINPFFLSCTRRNEHQAKDFSPMSRFCKTELNEAIDQMEALLKSPNLDLLPPDKESRDPGLHSSPKLSRDVLPLGVGSSATALDVVKSPATPPEPSSFASASASSAASTDPPLPGHDTAAFADADLTEEKFRRVWEKGLPVVVTGLSHKFHIQWTPEYFSTKYGTQSCLILECQTEQNKRVTVGDFFALFGKYEGRRDCWKLKDWPPSTDFKTAFPELYDDFSRATPVPNYVRRDGVLNIASHFPSNTIAPDLGPKMYNAMASFESQGSKGSTRLHMDMADAINIMTYASLTPSGRPGCAAWDIFRAEDTSKLRKFLKKKFKGQYQHDPIHSQQFYLDSSLRQELYKDHGVMSHRVYQRPGDAVFIPAGCAHQVCNLADCIKVACDFVSPENIDRCENLTSEFREQNQSMAWKEDVLQLRTMMWFSWLSCVRQEKEMLEG